MSIVKKSVSGIAMSLATCARSGVAAFLLAFMGLTVAGNAAAEDETPAEVETAAKQEVAAEQETPVAAETAAKKDTVLRTYSVADVPNVHIVNALEYTSDPAKLLSAAAKDSINIMLKELEDSTTAKVAVVMLPSIGETDIMDFSIDLFREWGLGDKDKNNGMLILYVEDQHAIRFHVGYGLEGAMPDAMAKRIQNSAMIPCFKNGDTDGGMKAGVLYACTVIKGGELPETDDDGESSGLIGLCLLAFVAFPSIPIIMVMMRKCPKCQKRGKVRSFGKQQTIEKDGVKYLRQEYKCKACGHTYFVDSKVVESSGVSSGGTSSGGSSWSGPTGGSWGGGTCGGAGATSRW
ncbi:MAG: TPM domain-containing protein [Bacteroidales bacterium]|nr:TPM domain-containing protein [Bacteroidales bacterium]